MTTVHLLVWIGLVTAWSMGFALVIYINVDQYKRKKASLLKRMEDESLCTCRHKKWFHGPSDMKPQVRSRCFSNDITNDGLCRCPGFKRDNLLYMERLYNGR